jgi:DNA-binding NarL/FixJ family response regulator
VVLADDSPEVLCEVRLLLAAEFHVLRAVDDGTILIEAVEEARPDAVITDLNMPGMDGISAAAQILRKRLCEAVIVLTMYSDAHLVTKALDAGIRGYVLKVDAGQELIPAVFAALRGDIYLSRGVRRNWRGESPK